MGIGLTVVILLEVVVFTILGCAFWQHLGNIVKEAQKAEDRKQLRPERILRDFERGV